MNLTVLKSILPRVPQLSSPVAVALGSWNLITIVLMLSGSFLVGIISGILFFMMATTVHKLSKTRSVKWRVGMLVIIFSLKLIPVGVESVVIHHDEVVQMQASTPPLPAVPTHNIEMLTRHECKSLEIAKDLIFLKKTHPTDLILAVLISFFALAAVDLIALVIDYLSFLSGGDESGGGSGQYK